MWVKAKQGTKNRQYSSPQSQKANFVLSNDKNQELQLTSIIVTPNSAPDNPGGSPHA